VRPQTKGRSFRELSGLGETYGAPEGRRLAVCGVFYYVIILADVDILSSLATPLAAVIGEAMRLLPDL